jgi:hypothetical protein
VGGVVRPRPRGILAGNSKELPCMVTTLLIDGNDIPPIDTKAKRLRTKAKSLKKGSYRVALKARSSNEGI